jgi:hypothetical protein
MTQSLSLNLNCLFLLFASTYAFLKPSNRYINIPKLQRHLDGSKHQLTMSVNVANTVIDDDYKPPRDYSIKILNAIEELKRYIPINISIYMDV